MRWLLLLALALAACKAEPPRHRATGTLVRSGVDADDQARWATELALLRSGAVLDDVVRALSERGVTLTADELRRGVSARRVKDARLIEVSVALADRLLAREACNQLQQSYLARRLDGAGAVSATERKAAMTAVDELRAQLVASDGKDPAMAAKYDLAVQRARELELSRGELRNDVLILDACR